MYWQFYIFLIYGMAVFHTTSGASQKIHSLKKIPLTSDRSRINQYPANLKRPVSKFALALNEERDLEIFLKRIIRRGMRLPRRLVRRIVSALIIPGLIGGLLSGTLITSAISLGAGVLSGWGYKGGVNAVTTNAATAALVRENKNWYKDYRSRSGDGADVTEPTHQKYEIMGILPVTQLVSKHYVVVLIKKKKRLNNKVMNMSKGPY